MRYPLATDVGRGEVAWYMSLEEVMIGYFALGFDYAFNGDLRPDVAKQSKGFLRGDLDDRSN